MYEMLDRAYLDGARFICFTPHYHPGYYGRNRDKSQKAFELISDYAERKYPDLTLALGNELHYERGCVSWLAEGGCRTLNGTKYVLIDFRQSETEHNIRDGIDSLLRAGYTPILAHAERYDEISRNMDFFLKYKGCGMLIQINAGSLFNRFGRRSKSAVKKLLKMRLADFVSSDAHNLDTRPPGMDEAFAYISKKYSEEYAEALCLYTAQRLVFKHTDNE